MWFTRLTGITEGPLPDMQTQLAVEGDWLTSLANGRKMRLGRFEMPSLDELRARTAGLPGRGRTTVREVQGPVQALYGEPALGGALFQAASQFNLLEMVGPSVTPEKGLNIYAHDNTQGPACAMACGAGTIWRALLMPLPGGAGQTATRQADGAGDLHAALGGDLWDMRNGYLTPRKGGLKRAAEAIATDADRLRGLLRIGVHFDTEVTALPDGPLVAQAYCSACPCAYVPAPDWEPLARLVLEATYEATLHAAVLNAEATGNRRVVLTQVGGGVFGNDKAWIMAAIRRALDVVEHAGLEVWINTYRGSDPHVARLVADWQAA